jgi:hypothetical protein
MGATSARAYRSAMLTETAPPPALTLEDSLAINTLVNDYAWLLDHRRWHEVADLCVDDVVFSIRGREIIGKNGLADWADARAAKTNRRTQHQTTLQRLEFTGPDEATGSSALVLHLAKAGGGSYVDLVGEYRDEYVRTASGWRFRSRRLVKIEDA